MPTAINLPSAHHASQWVRLLLAATLLASGAATATQAPSSDQARWQHEAQAVTITRDDWGIAHVHGKTDADAVFGMSYAQAEDDFNRIETNYLNAMGRLAETEGENRYCLELHQCRPLDYLEACGWLGERTWLAHGVHFNGDEFKRLARAGTAVTHCACSNQVLASGTCPVCELEEAGVAVGLGVDGSASNDSSNLMQEVRAAFLLQRGRYGIRKVSHRDALRWATKGSAACVGRPDVGDIGVGMQADLALFRLDELRFSGSGDPLAALVLCGAHRADRVMVGGRWVVENAQIPGLDVADLIRRHSAAARKLLG